MEVTTIGIDVAKGTGREERWPMNPGFSLPNRTSNRVTLNVRGTTSRTAASRRFCPRAGEPSRPENPGAQTLSFVELTARKGGQKLRLLYYAKLLLLPATASIRLTISSHNVALWTSVKPAARTAASVSRSSLAPHT